MAIISNKHYCSKNNEHALLPEYLKLDLVKKVRRFYRDHSYCDFHKHLKESTFEIAFKNKSFKVARFLIRHHEGLDDAVNIPFVETLQLSDFANILSRNADALMKYRAGDNGTLLHRICRSKKEKGRVPLRVIQLFAKFMDLLKEKLKFGSVDENEKVKKYLLSKDNYGKTALNYAAQNILNFFQNRISRSIMHF